MKTIEPQSDDHKKPPKTQSPHSIDSAWLQKQVELNRNHLENIGHELLGEISFEFMELAGFLGECHQHPTLEVTTGGFASIIYRMCEVAKLTAALGMDASNAANSSPIADSSCNGHPFSEKLAAQQAQLGHVADQLDILYSSYLCFLPCDLVVLAGHPEVSRIRALCDTLDLINDQISDLEGRIENIKALARQHSQLAIADEIPRPPTNNDRSWKTISAMLEQCTQKALQTIEADSPIREEGPIMHPKRNDAGKKVTINQPTTPSTAASWSDSKATATFVPRGKVPKIINGIAVSAWTDPPETNAAWNALDLLMPSLQEPPLPKSSLKVASGVVTIEPDGRVWIVSPTNAYGYKNSFPKGKWDNPSLTMQANAIKEGFEESGLKVRITGYLGDFKRTTSMTRLYLAERIGGDPTDMGWESQAVHLVPRAKLVDFLTELADQPILKALP